MKLWALVVVAALFSAACSGACRTQAPEQAEHDDEHADKAPESAAANEVRIAEEMMRDLQVTTIVVATHAAADGAAMLGQVEVDPDRYAELSSPIPAQVISLHAGLNAAVKGGQPLAELRSVELGRSRAALITAESRVALAQQVVDRKRALAADRLVALREVQEAEAVLAAAQAEQRAATASLQALGVSLTGQAENPSAFTLRAPIGGTVIERTAVLGQQVDPAQPLFKIADLSHVWVIVQAFERDAARVRLGAQARVTFAALPGESFAATVASVGRQVDPESRTVPIRLTVSGDAAGLRPGMAATSVITVGERAGTIIAVPSAAVQRIGSAWVVFVPREEGLYEIRQIGRGRDIGGEVEILSGLKAGETIVVNGAFLLKAEAEKARGQGDPHGHGE